MMLWYDVYDYHIPDAAFNRDTMFVDKSQTFNLYTLTICIDLPKTKDGKIYSTSLV